MPYKSYKKEAEKLKTENELKRQANEFLEKQLKTANDKLKAIDEEKKKRYSAYVYCSNCTVVSSVSIPPGVAIVEGDCVNCRVRSSQLRQTLFLVTKYPGMI